MEGADEEVLPLTADERCVHDLELDEPKSQGVNQTF